MADKQILSNWRAASEFTMWYDDTLWLPFVEDEDCNITGPGHQDKSIFADLVNNYDAHASGEPVDTPWTAKDISHGYGVLFENEYNELYFLRAKKDDEGAIPITTLWGAR